jgi:Tannase and feruloyl esterase
MDAPMKTHSILLTTLFLTGAVTASAATCESLGSLKFNDATVATAAAVPAGSFSPPGGGTVKPTADFCRVAMVLKPSADSDINVEVWMPSSGWNGKFQGVGNGGFAGSIDYAALAAAVSKGYAAAATDTGHKAGATDAQWALNHPEKITDFGYRAIHETANHAKTVIKAMYGDNPKRSYFASCSNGGRQALMEAQKFPADYDGIVAGAPAGFWTHLLVSGMFNMQAIADAAAYIPSAKLPAIEQAALTQCDALDGVKDGVIENPMSCKFNTAVLACKAGEESNACLTAPQLAALNKIYTGPKTSDGKQVLAGFSHGGEAELGGWASWIDGAAPGKSLQYAFGTNFFKYMVFNDADWDYKTATVDHNVKLADDKFAGTLNATNTDLSAFKSRGGKLIMYHGWADAAIPPTNTVSYYDAVKSKMGEKDADGFVRLFMVPGMEHCGGGAGVSVGAGVPREDADHDIDAALEKWVEQGVAPNQIIARKGTSRTRPLCAWPQTAHYKGSGSTDDAANFSCSK